MSIYTRRAVALGSALAVMVLAAPIAPARADTPRNREWWIAPLKIEQAHELSRGDGVVVGVVDTAIDASHPALKGRVLPGKGQAAEDPQNGWGGGQGASHGTAMAGLIVGSDSGASSYTGLAPGAKVLPYASEDKKTNIAAGIRWLTDHGAKVINMSLGTTVDLPETAEAVRYALNKDVVLVAASGNTDESGPNVVSPARIPGVLAVAGVVRNGDAWSLAGHGSEVGIAAPAVDIIYPAPAGTSKSGYRIGEGTSEATAIVSGVAALIRSKYPNLNAASVIERLIKTARDNGDPGRDPKFGFGTVRPYEALTANVAPVDKNPLGEPGGATPASPGAGKGVTFPPNASADDDSGSFLIPGLLIGGGVLFLILIAGIVVAVVSSRKKKVDGFGSAGYPPGYPPQQNYPGYPPPHVPHQQPWQNQHQGQPPPPPH